MEKLLKVFFNSNEDAHPYPEYERIFGEGNPEYLKFINIDKENIIFIVNSCELYELDYKFSFIVNCLCLSNSVSLEDINTPTEKLEKLLEWLLSPDQKLNSTSLRYEINPNTSLFSKENNKNFYFLSSKEIINPLIDKLNNCKIIYCYNNLLFDSILFEDQIKMTMKEYISLPQNIKEIIQRKYEKKKLSNSSQNYLKNKFLYNWNVNWFFSKEETLKNIEKIYWILKLPDYNNVLIGKYYDEWINYMNDISSQAKYPENKTILI